MTYGPDMTPEVEAKLKAEIAAFDSKATLEEIEREAVGGNDINAYQKWREERDQQKLPTEAEPDLVAEDDAPNFDKPMFSKQIVLATLEIRELLSFRELQVWHLVMRNGWSVKEAASKLGIGERTVEEYLSRGKEKVINHFKDVTIE